MNIEEAKKIVDDIMTSEPPNYRYFLSVEESAKEASIDGSCTAEELKAILIVMTGVEIA